MKKVFSSFLFLIAGLITIISLLTFLARLHWSIDLLNHFKPQYLIIISICTITLLIFKKKKALLFSPIVILLTIVIIPIYFGGNKDQALTSTIKVISINLLSSNKAYDDVAAFIKSENPEIIVLEELNKTWSSKLTPEIQAYQHSFILPQEGNFGIAIFSKLPFSKVQKIVIGQAQLPTIIADFNLNGTETKIIATHPLPPIGAYYSYLRNDQLAALSGLIQKNETETILIGDLNTSSFSPHFKDLLKNSGLIDSRKGFGLQPTWPAGISLLGTSLDHCLISKNLRVKERIVGKNVGSDHLPILLELGTVLK